MQAYLIGLALAFYGAGVALTVPSVARRRPYLSPVSLGAIGLGLLLHAAALAAQARELHRLPIADVRSALSFFTFLATLAFFGVYLRYRITSLGIFMLPLVLVLTLISALQPVRSFESAAFRGGWLVVHTATVLVGYVGFLLAFVAAIMYLIQENALKSKHPHAFYSRLPSLEVSDELYYRSLLVGFPFLTLGILMGFVWASRNWKGPWELDPKILASLFTWLIYLVLFSTRLGGNWGGRRSAYAAIFGFAAVMLTFLGVSFLSSQHGYFPNLSSMP